VISPSTLGDAFPIAALGEVAEFLDSRRRPVTASDRRVGPYPYFGANGVQGMIDDYLFDEPLVLLAEDGGHFDNPSRGIAYRIAGKTWVNNHAHVLRPGDRIQLSYLHRVLEHYDVRSFVTGTTRGKLTQAGAARIPIPLPPLSEQQRITDILDQADALRFKRSESIERIDLLNQGSLSRMISTSRVRLSVALSKISSLKRGPFGGALRKDIFVSHGFKVYEQRNAISQDFAAGSYFITPAKFKEMSGFAVAANDLIMSCSGTIGKSAIVPSDFTPGIINQALLRIRVDDSEVLPDYLKSVLDAPQVQRQLHGFVHGSGLQNFPAMSEVKNIEIPLIPMPDQHLFVALKRKTQALGSLLQSSAESLDDLFASLQHRAFQGEL
jgi:type I restriction enzyme S subunit